MNRKFFQSRITDRKRDISRLIIFPLYLFSFYLIFITTDYFEVKYNIVRNNVIIRLFLYIFLFIGTQIILRFSEDFLRKILEKKNIEIEKETWTLIHIVVIITFFILVSITNY